MDYFINVAGIGYDAHVVNLVGNNRVFGTVSYLIGALKGLFSFPNFNTTVTAEGYGYYGEAFMLQVGICEYTGGGMKLTETPNTKDGLLDITIAKDFTMWDIIKNLRKLFNGQIVKHTKVDTFKTNKITVITKANNKPYIQADGENLGKDSVEISILKQALRFYC